MVLFSPQYPAIHQLCCVDDLLPSCVPAATQPPNGRRCSREGVCVVKAHKGVVWKPPLVPTLPGAFSTVSGPPMPSRPHPNPPKPPSGSVAPNKSAPDPPTPPTRFHP
eukprot:scaffold4552_cov207-Skeletonema_marinoi.AAC.1